MRTTAVSPIPANPSDVACIDLVNSTFSDHLGTGEHMDRIRLAAWQRWFIDRYELAPRRLGPPPLDNLIALRTDLRRILVKWSHEQLTSNDARLLDAWVRNATVRRRVVLAEEALEVREEPLERTWSFVLAEIARSAVELISAGEPRRLKVCANPDCSWMFYDQTVNGSKRCCSTTPCASLLRVRRFREQH